jgi:hypothetical protein
VDCCLLGRTIFVVSLLRAGFFRTLVSSIFFRRMDFFLMLRSAQSGQTGSSFWSGVDAHDSGSGLSHWMQRLFAICFP